MFSKWDRIANCIIFITLSLYLQHSKMVSMKIPHLPGKKKLLAATRLHFSFCFLKCSGQIFENLNRRWVSSLPSLWDPSKKEEVSGVLPFLLPCVKLTMLSPLLLPQPSILCTKNPTWAQICWEQCHSKQSSNLIHAVRHENQVLKNSTRCGAVTNWPEQSVYAWAG